RSASPSTLFVMRVIAGIISSSKIGANCSNFVVSITLNLTSIPRSPAIALSPVPCHLSPVPCHLSPVPCHLSPSSLRMRHPSQSRTRRHIQILSHASRADLGIFPDPDVRVVLSSILLRAFLVFAGFRLIETRASHRHFGSFAGLGEKLRELI